ncbi:5'/3'-nucleotidase SurE [Marinilabiliaceae bacterium JC017]|nr:5'/3'-nucleotidase SurE [Marinilabiliaceae bacterium JC017]
MTKISNNRPLFLITNDDGIKAGGIKALVEMVRPIGDVVVVAPNQSYSGMSHAITVSVPLYVKEVVNEDGLLVYKVNGTPADCIKLAVRTLLDRKPDYILSGINHGSNSSASVHYSGTLGGAREGALNGIPSIGFSLLNYSYEADFSKAMPFARHVLSYVIKNGLPEGTFLNVNFPDGDSLKGIKVCRQAKGKWVEEFIERKDPRQRRYFWLTGHFKNLEPQATDTDEYALENRYVSVVPCSIDITDNDLLVHLQKMKHEFQMQ